MLKGKQGRFRQNLLGKRVDYSGRSVIVVGPSLKLHQCGLPKKMAIELFKPFLYNKLEEHGIVSSIKSAKKLVEKEHPEVWDILEEVTSEHPVLLNRAPTLHRLGIQGFEPVLIEGKAIRLHPLVCFAFNADFDGDQMAVHVPLSVESQMEARVLMMSSNNILSPASGSPVIIPSQDIVLGLYYLTKEDISGQGAGKIFSSLEEVRSAYDHGEVSLQAPISVRLRNNERVKTTVGRALLSELIPDDVPFSAFNKTMGKKELGKLVDETFRTCGPKKTVLMADAIRTAGFHYSTRAGMSIAIGDMIIPEEKDGLLGEAYEEVKRIKEQYSEGLLTEGERYNKVVDIWAKVTENIAESMFNNIAKMKVKDHEGKEHVVPSNNSVFMMADSGARGSAQQIRQLAGMRGLMSKPSGEIIETPITANFREGLSVLEYFTSTHGARKGLADTALKTASSGYLTRRLVDVAQDAIITMDDCGTTDGLKMMAIRDGSEIIVPLKDRILGRTALDDIKHPETGEILAKKGELLDEATCEEINDAGVEAADVRSVLTCRSKRGICAKCYGRDLASGRKVDVGEAIGVIAAQSIGEPGTQLTMRTFHFGGTATHKVETNVIETRFSGKIKYDGIRAVTDRHGRNVVLSRSGLIAILDNEDKVKDTHPIPYGTMLSVKEGEEVKAGAQLGEWDTFATPIVAEISGKLRYQDLKSGKSLEEKVDDVTFLTRKVVIEAKGESLKPRLVIVDDSGEIIKLESGREAIYTIPVGATISFDEGVDVSAGDVLAKIPKETTKTKDITGGLPRVAELFEARKPKEMSVMADRDGTVSFGDDTKGKRKLLLTDEEGGQKEYLIPKGKHILVNEGDYVRKGDALVDGQPNPHEILAVLGRVELAAFLVNEIQDVYRLQGVKINDKHIEVIVRQMLRRVKVIDAGDTRFLPGEQASRAEVQDANAALVAEGKTPATWEPLLLGITKSSLTTESFISAASFQETTKVLTEAAINSRVDHLGRLIPAGTGSLYYRQLRAGLPEKENEVVNEGESAPAQVNA